MGACGGNEFAKAAGGNTETRALHLEFLSRRAVLSRGGAARSRPHLSASCSTHPSVLSAIVLVSLCVCVRVCVFVPFVRTSVHLSVQCTTLLRCMFSVQRNASAGVAQEETLLNIFCFPPIFLLLCSLVVVARRVQAVPFSLVSGEVEVCCSMVFNFRLQICKFASHVGIRTHHFLLLAAGCKVTTRCPGDGSSCCICSSSVRHVLFAALKGVFLVFGLTSLRLLKN